MAAVNGYGPAGGGAGAGLRASPYDRPGLNGSSVAGGGLSEYQRFAQDMQASGMGHLIAAPGLPPGGGREECQFYAKAGWCKYGSACRFAHVGPARPPPEVGGAVVCMFFQKAGWCRWGDTCRHAHPGAQPGATPTSPHAVHPEARFSPRDTLFSSQACQFYQKAGWCKWADQCRYLHGGAPTLGSNGQVPANVPPPAVQPPPPSFGGIPGQPSVCKYFQMPGGCRQGQNCKFLHTGEVAQPEVCNFFAREGWCKFADTCRYIHVYAGGGPGGPGSPPGMPGPGAGCMGGGGLQDQLFSGLGGCGGGAVNGVAGSALGEADPVGGAGLAAAFEGLQRAISKVAPGM